MKSLFGQLYAGSKAPKSGQPTLWHLSYNQRDNPGRRALCGNRARVDDERVIFTVDELHKIIDPPNQDLFGGSNKLCERCDKAGPWPTTAKS